MGMYNMQQMIICYGCMQKRMDHKLTNVIEQMTIHLCGHAQGQLADHHFGRMDSRTSLERTFESLEWCDMAKHYINIDIIQ